MTKQSKKNTYYRVVVDDEQYGLMELKHAEAFIRESFKDCDSTCEILVEKVLMTEKQFKKLPEHEV